MQTTTGLQPWYLAYFLVVWAFTMAYVVTFFATVLRIRVFTGESTGPGDWLVVWRDPRTVRYLRWVFSARHREAGDPALSRMVLIVRVLFLADAPAMLLVFLLLPWGALPRPHGAEADFQLTPSAPARTGP